MTKTRRVEKSMEKRCKPADGASVPMCPQGNLAALTNAEVPVRINIHWDLKAKNAFGVLILESVIMSTLSSTQTLSASSRSASPAWEDHDALLPVLANHTQLVLPLPLNLSQQLK